MRRTAPLPTWIPLIPPLPADTIPTRGMAWTDLPERRTLIVLGLMLSLAFIALTAAQVWLRLQAIDLRYRLGTAQQVASRLHAEREVLLSRLARLEEPSHLESLAAKRLGLSRPQKGQEAYLP